MPHLRYLAPQFAVLIAISLIGGASAFAQGAGVGAQIGAPGTGSVPPVGAPPNPAAAPGSPSSSPTTGTGTATGFQVNPTHNQPGVPDTSTPGRFGTNAAPSGLPGDDPAHPGFPARVGK